ncbi:hypothetical protein [Candidatus Liberibacter solanacearum]|uniref:Uncharacterized protein n=1 Tax=Candidatus Liberibacter solanacearum TaxID=556287 RepID=A0A1V2N9J4_9HYPH|nr:hypothetical protein [Candidatus Liberibacter solanacearum]ONI58955.1 hypothetical protein AYJ09_00740 [Candidatus Liberibacter solanacearum]ONI60331.1 hypothetical protein AYO25_00525 [Candidatus Liberibacter solanacearum]
MLSKKFVLTSVLLESSVLLSGCDTVSKEMYNNLEKSLEKSKNSTSILEKYLYDNQGKIESKIDQKNKEMNEKVSSEARLMTIINSRKNIINNPSETEQNKALAKEYIEKNESKLASETFSKTKSELELIELEKEREYGENINKKYHDSLY